MQYLTEYILELVLHIDHEVLRKWLPDDWQVLFTKCSIVSVLLDVLLGS